MIIINNNNNNLSRVGGRAAVFSRVVLFSDICRTFQDHFVSPTLPS